MRFEDYWENYGELHASMCGGNIKQFAKEIWMSAKAGNVCCPECKRVLKPDQAEETNAPSTVLIKLLERLSSASKDCLASSDMAQVAHQIAHEYEELTKESGR